MVRRKIVTNSGEIYKKFNMLNFTNEILLKDVKSHQLNRILNNINSDKMILSSEKIGDYFVIKKVSPINFSVYFR